MFKTIYKVYKVSKHHEPYIHNNCMDNYALFTVTNQINQKSLRQVLTPVWGTQTTQQLIRHRDHRPWKPWPFCNKCMGCVLWRSSSNSVKTYCTENGGMSSYVVLKIPTATIRPSSLLELNLCNDMLLLLLVGACQCQQNRKKYASFSIPG